MTIQEQIDNIIAKRKTHLPSIAQNLSGLTSTKEKIDSLCNLLNIIRNQRLEQKGQYYQMLNMDPDMATKMDNISQMMTLNKDKQQFRFEKLDYLLEKYIEELEAMQTRFERNAIQVAFIGRERMGKSTFLQSITGLENKIIPAFDGTSCTGALSTIVNIPDDNDPQNGFRVEIEFLDASSFLNEVKAKIAEIYPQDSIDPDSITSLDEFGKLEIDKFSPNEGIDAAVTKTLEHKIRFLKDYREYIGRRDKIILTSPDEIVQFVAQYEKFENKPENVDKEHLREIEDGRWKWQRLYFKFFAVKSVKIFKHFPTTDCGKMILVDTVGLGNPADGDLPQKKMIDTLRYDCDAAVDIFLPNALGDSFNDKQRSILKMIRETFPDREVNKWFAYILNRVNDGKGKNTHLISSIKTEIEDDIRLNHRNDFIWLEDCDGANPNEVREKLLMPLLENVIQNLDVIDNSLLDKLNSVGEKLYQEIFLIYNNISNVISHSFKANVSLSKMFDNLFSQLQLFSSLRELDEQIYASNRNKVCTEVAERLEKITSGLYDLIPSKKDIEIEVEKGIQASPQIYVDFINVFRNKIFDSFESVSSEVIIPLQNKVKLDILNALFNDGLLRNIPLLGISSNFEPSIVWLETMITEKICKEEYPKLNEALKYILDYNVSIDGLIEYNVARCLEEIDPMSSKFVQMKPIDTAIAVEEKADDIWQWIIGTVSDLQTQLRSWQKDFSLIPSHSFYARVHKFREKIIWDEQGKIDIKNFYLDNASSIWQDTFRNNTIVSQAFGSWNDVVSSFKESCSRQLYVISL